MHISNKYNIPLVAAVWALADTYDYVDMPNYISATTLLKPVQEIVLRDRLEKDNKLNLDVADLLASAMGTSIHAGVEAAWKTHYEKALKTLGYDDDTIKLVKINPDPSTLSQGAIPIYLEQRSFKEIEGFVVGGKYDIVVEGRLHDVKSTSVYSWIHGSNDHNYKLQGSIYRWLNPSIITNRHITIVYVFTDWSKSASRSNPNYPPNRVVSVDIELFSLADTEEIIRNKLQAVKKESLLPKEELTECTPIELWLKDPVYKYYSDPTKINGRSTKNFTSLNEANAHLLSKGKGIVKTVESLPARCDYCSVMNLCEQRSRIFDNYIWEEED